MRFSTAAALAAVTAPIAVSAKGGRLGFALGVRNEGEPCFSVSGKICCGADYVTKINLARPRKTLSRTLTSSKQLKLPIK